MTRLILDTFPTLLHALRVETTFKEYLWIMDKEKTGSLAVPPSVTEICFADTLEHPKQTKITIQMLRESGFKGNIVLATPNGQTPGHIDGVETLAPQQIQPIQLLHYGDHTAKIMAKGLILTDDPPLFLKRPERLCVEPNTTIQQLRNGMNAFLELCGNDLAARTVRTEGSLLFGDAHRTREWLASLLSLPLTWTASTFRGSGSAAHLIATLRALLAYQVHRPQDAPVRFEMQTKPDPLLDAAFGLLNAKPVTGNQLQALHSLWHPMIEPQSPLFKDLRKLDDADRELTFQHLPKTGSIERSPVAQYARRVLGSPESWIQSYRRTLRQESPKLCLVPTWQCELRCQYCGIVKQSGREMSETIALQGLELLLSAPGPHVELHFCGGEPFLEWPLLETITREGHARAIAEGKTLRVQFTTNAYALTEAHLDALAPYNCHFQLSLDGDEHTQNTVRKTSASGHSYATSAARKASWFSTRSLSHEVITVVHPSNVERMVENVVHIWDLGYSTIHLHPAGGTQWDPQATQAWSRGLDALQHQRQKRSDAGETLTLVTPSKRTGSSLHLTVDWDGELYGSSGFLYLEKEKKRFHIGHLNQGHSYTRYLANGLTHAGAFPGWLGQRPLA